MQTKKAYRYRLEPTEEQREAFERYAGCCRYVWNWFRSQREAWYQSGASQLPTDERDSEINPNGYGNQSRQLPPLKLFFPWLSDAPSQCLQQTLKDLDRAYIDFFKGNKGYPQYRKRGMHDSFRFPDPKGFRVDEGTKSLFLPKVGRVRLRLSRPVKGILKNVTVSRRGRHWYASIQVEEVLTLPKAPPVSIGIDLGVSDMVAFSNGNRHKALDFKRLERIRLRAQRQLSRKNKGSANWHKARNRLSRVHERIADKRNDSLHKLSTAISKNHALIVVENLCVKEMSSSARGDKDNPGKEIKQKAGLNRAILAQGWGEFVRQLEYKSHWRGGALMKIAPHYTSQQCHRCGHTDPTNRKGKRFRCLLCGYSEDADTQAAKNILAAGLAASACGGYAVGRPVKQEPEEVVRPPLLGVP